MNAHNEDQGATEKRFSIKITSVVEISKEDVDDLMCSALEGGICYWCGKAEVVGDYLADYAHEQIARGGVLRLYDTEAGEVHELNRDNFFKGLTLFLQHGNQHLIENRRIDPGDFDADCTDSIIQYALFGEIVYS